ncbi:hypothetical protein RHGRI_009999 [Rhododendron griersonianum]|uniref:TraB domain-containing protein n=1 Tax=Rhododendron griersonianum TaxID=479676 RepID=A0AAV6KHH8_9ERIC|nr:hypothetical protein RHGRI_009999 [Rhododendron griersonianum]
MEALFMNQPDSDAPTPAPTKAEHFVISIDGLASPVLGDPSTGIDAAAVADRTEVQLPDELRRKVVKLSCKSTAEGGSCVVYLVGTAHVSQESCQEVKAVVGLVKPQVVFLELCPGRKAVLLPQNLKVASKLEVCPGSEFRVAWEEALKYDDKAQVKLGDRPITLQRTWAKMPLWHKTKLLYSVVIQAFFLPSSEDLNKMLKEMDDVDMLTRVIQDMSKQFPTLMETLVHERDQYMSATLLEVAGMHSSIVAVVGKGHLEGIKKYWKQSVESGSYGIDFLQQYLLISVFLNSSSIMLQLEHLQHVDMTSWRLAISAVKFLTTVGVAAAGVAMISGLRVGWLF